MRKWLAIFIVALIILGMALTIVGLAVPSVGEGLHYLFIKVIGEGGATWFSGLVSGVLTWGASGGLLTAAAIFLPPLFVGIFIAGAVHKLWQKRPSFLGGQKTGQSLGFSTTVAKDEPRDIVTTETAAPLKPVEKEATA